MSKKKKNKHKTPYNAQGAPKPKQTDLEAKEEVTSPVNDELDTPETRQTVSEEVFFDTEAEENGKDPEEKEVTGIWEETVAGEKEEDKNASDEKSSIESSSESQYCEKAREEFAEAQRKQASKAKSTKSEEINADKEKDLKRQLRRKRRIRNQVISYLAVCVFLAVVIGGGFFAVKVFLIDAGVFSGKSGEVVSDLPDVVVEEEPQEDTEEDLLPEEVEDTEPVETVDDNAGENKEEQPVEEPVTTDENAQLDTYIDGIIAGMTIEQKVAGIIMTSPEALTKVNLATRAGEGTKAALESYQVGGIVYDEKNVTSHDQFRDMITGTVAMVSVPTFFAIAEEGGKNSSPIAKVDFYEAVGSASDIAQTNDVDNALNAGVTIGSALSELGFNVNLAPIADLSSDAPENLDGRTYGSSAMDSVGYVSKVSEGLESAGVTSCLKFFPGQGFAGGNPRDGRVVIDKSEEDYRKGDILVYQAMIESGAKMIEISNAVITSFDDSQPASLSEHIVTDILRNELGFNGVILSGNLGDKAIMDYYGADEAAILALKAGCDMLLNPYEFETAYNGIIKAVEEGVVSEERINDALKRIYRIKYAGSI